MQVKQLISFHINSSSASRCQGFHIGVWNWWLLVISVETLICSAGAGFSSLTIFEIWLSLTWYPEIIPGMMVLFYLVLTPPEKWSHLWDPCLVLVSLIPADTFGTKFLLGWFYIPWYHLVSLPLFIAGSLLRTFSDPGVVSFIHFIMKPMFQHAGPMELCLCLFWSD